MNTFDTDYELDDANATILLALPFEIYNLQLEIDYTISKFYPATLYSPAEYGEIDDCDINIVSINDHINITDTQAKLLHDLLDEEKINEMIWHHYNTQ